MNCILQGVGAVKHLLKARLLWLVEAHGTWVTFSALNVVMYATYPSSRPSMENPETDLDFLAVQSRIQVCREGWVRLVCPMLPEPLQWQMQEVQEADH